MITYRPLAVAIGSYNQRVKMPKPLSKISRRREEERKRRRGRNSNTNREIEGISKSLVIALIICESREAVDDQWRG